MRLKSLGSFSLGGGKDVAPGDEFEVDDARAAVMLRLRWAEEVQRVEPMPTRDTIISREPAVEHREPVNEED